ncbi:MAG: PhzF family phenazine biosynthesis protein [Pseudomonadota bacterium]|jgi:PhzF family phenazine biosynthesis protein|nr:PhzF family phenazine biosynthesis protein [Pseudomonadota bacterium]MEC9099642.1 PhzF family phenazine biosynthesis protein [Pseudomonadota bacterium]MED5225911.1 PhzF family phenazine biosynthesis protein [Pseudomonadota bacterium]|tara:strand:- start:7753 stop:8541 length:789 start_codon:yes stop_codon:yes gene_type:complete
MTKIPIFQVDAFADKVFSGNPAAVCPIMQELDESQMQHIAAENNLSETAFIKIDTEPYSIRWFTPTIEVDLCGHATLAAASVLFEEYVGARKTEVRFSSKSGELVASKNDGMIYLDFPVDYPTHLEKNSLIPEALGIQPIGYYKGKFDILVEFPTEREIREIDPDYRLLERLNSRGLIATAPGVEVDFVSRFFAPQVGIDEDPVTGSAHTTLTPFWSERLGKKDLDAQQLSSRGGRLHCKLLSDRVLIGGKTARYLSGFLNI